MKITVRIKDVYGEAKIYPVCNAAIAFSCIAGTKTLTRNTIKQIKVLGYEIQVITEQINIAA